MNAKALDCSKNKERRKYDKWIKNQAETRAEAVFELLG